MSTYCVHSAFNWECHICKNSFSLIFCFFLSRYSGPTVHFVDEEYDTGHILAQRVVPVLSNDTPEELAARVLHEVREIYIILRVLID